MNNNNDNNGNDVNNNAGILYKKSPGCRYGNPGGIIY